MANKEENAADITITINDVTIVVDQLQVNEDIDIQKRYGSGYNFPSGRSMGHIDVTGSYTIVGVGSAELNSLFFNENGKPKEFDAITISHDNGETTEVKDCIVQNRGYEVNDGEMTETSYEYDAMRISHPFETSGASGQ
jgi:hypothetical protein